MNEKLQKVMPLYAGNTCTVAIGGNDLWFIFCNVFGGHCVSLISRKSMTIISELITFKFGNQIIFLINIYIFMHLLFVHNNPKYKYQ